jgi:4-diphosphocytidyl-2-C-methyl-D-erythritol kinase
MSVPGRDRPSGATARVVAQAKVNLFLRVLAREASGYHQLETLFCRLELGDDVTVRTDVRGRSLDCHGDVVPSAGLGPIEQNLAWRAAVAYADATGWPNAWAIDVAKRIPVGGGLGGGSADAGAVLRCLNAINPAPISGQALLGLAAALGADVPFLTAEATLALAWGRGERLLALPALPVRQVGLVTFPFGVSTRDAYGWLDADTTNHRARSDLVDVRALEGWNGVARLAHNDFEAVVAPRYPAIAAALADLRSGSPACDDPSAIVLMAGSGATVFIVADSSPPDMVGTHTESSRRVQTRTAGRVVAVDVSG